MTEKNQFPLEKILALNIRDYCDIVGKGLSDYEPVGVHAAGESTGMNLESEGNTPIKRFAEKVPPHTEVVVNYQLINISGGKTFGQYIATGVALIPKKK